MPTLATASDCPICGGASPLLAHGVVAPFVSELAGLPMGQPTSLRLCEGCDLAFFDARYGEDEMSTLYGSYRSESYSAVRRRWEPWYSRSVNDAYSDGGGAVDARVDFMMSVLGAAKVKDPFECVVDFGGDEGQFFPKVSIERRIVCDVSERELSPGVERIATLGELGDTKPDLVIIAHVLEHLPDPLGPLLEIRQAIADDGILYVEIPLDRFRVRSYHATPGYQHNLGRLSRHRVPFVAADFISGISRQYRSSIPTFGVVKQSEHINYFSAGSVRAALAASGFSVLVERSNEDAKTGGLRMGAHGVAAMPDPAFSGGAVSS